MSGWLGIGAVVRLEFDRLGRLVVVIIGKLLVKFKFDVTFGLEVKFIVEPEVPFKFTSGLALLKSCAMFRSANPELF